MYAKPRTKGRGVSYGMIGLTTVAVTQHLSGMPFGSLRKKTHLPLERYIT